jgi:hypothetical protein
MWKGMWLHTSSVEVAWICGVYVILIKKYDKFLNLDQQGLKMLKTNKQLFVEAISWQEKHFLDLVGIFHHWETSSKKLFITSSKQKTLGCFKHTLERLKDLL